ncbi:hypothetical protein [Streptomyces sp. NPDC059744]|uniref:hypothetical protein n=1 Tax=Streptomyces sp. NPDC059744 TaxID=3346929 RepID=UPI00365C41B9
MPDTEYREETFILDEAARWSWSPTAWSKAPASRWRLERVGTLAGAALHDGLNAEETADRILDSAVAVDHADDVAVLVIRRT